MGTRRHEAVRAATTAASSLWTGALRFGVEERSGRHHWRLTTSDGRDLATSRAGFARHDEAQRAAGENRH